MIRSRLQAPAAPVTFRIASAPDRCCSLLLTTKNTKRQASRMRAPIDNRTGARSDPESTGFSRKLQP